MESSRESRIEDDPNKSYAIMEIRPQRNHNKLNILTDYFDNIKFEKDIESTIKDIKAPSIGTKIKKRKFEQE